MNCILYTVILFLFLALLLVGAGLVGSFAVSPGTHVVTKAEKQALINKGITAIPDKYKITSG